MGGHHVVAAVQLAAPRSSRTGPALRRVREFPRPVHDVAPGWSWCRGSARPASQGAGKQPIQPSRATLSQAPASLLRKGSEVKSSQARSSEQRRPGGQLRLHAGRAVAVVVYLQERLGPVQLLGSRFGPWHGHDRLARAREVPPGPRGHRARSGDHAARALPHRRPRHRACAVACVDPSCGMPRAATPRTSLSAYERSAIAGFAVMCYYQRAGGTFALLPLQPPGVVTACARIQCEFRQSPAPSPARRSGQPRARHLVAGLGGRLACPPVGRRSGIQGDRVMVAGLRSSRLAQPASLIVSSKSLRKARSTCLTPSSPARPSP